MKKILILGSSGMLGHMLFFYLQSLGKYILFDISSNRKLRDKSIAMDVRQTDALEKAIDSIQPDYIVNCVGILIRGSNENTGNSILINSFLPHALSEITLKYGCKLIHISTDCVFSGLKGWYSEYDFRDADDIYGRTKALGELNNMRDLTLRTSIIGPELKDNGEGLLHWVLKQQGEINGYADVYWTGLTTLQLSKIIEETIQDFIPGLYNLSNNTRISKYELIQIILKVFGRTISVKPSYGRNIDKSLRCELFNHRTTIPDYQTMLEELFEVMTSKNNPAYTKYFENR